MCALAVLHAPVIVESLWELKKIYSDKRDDSFVCVCVCIACKEAELSRHFQFGNWRIAAYMTEQHRSSQPGAEDEIKLRYGEVSNVTGNTWRNGFFGIVIQQIYYHFHAYRTNI
jgi:hypothetical protein